MIVGAYLRNGKGGHAIVFAGITKRQGEVVVAIRDPNGMQYFESIDYFLGEGR